MKVDGPRAAFLLATGEKAIADTGNRQISAVALANFIGGYNNNTVGMLGDGILVMVGEREENAWLSAAVLRYYVLVAALDTSCTCTL